MDFLGTDVNEILIRWQAGVKGAKEKSEKEG